MINYDDPRWTELRGGYRDVYDPRGALRALQDHGGSEEVWEELWSELHHQGDVDNASYAAVTVLAEIERTRGDLGWEAYAMVSTIESERHRKTNPDVPDWIRAAYGDALLKMRTCALAQLGATKDPQLTRAALSIVALTSGLWAHGLLLIGYEDDEIPELVEEQVGWSEQYANKGRIA